MQFPDINAGAELAAAGKTLGMSPDETYDFVIRKIQLTNAKRVRQGLPPIEEAAAFRGFLDKMAKVRGIDQYYPADIDDKRTIPNSQVEYGEEGNQNEFQNFGGVDSEGRVKDAEAGRKEKAAASGKRDPNELIRFYYDKVNKRPASETFYAGDGSPIPERFRDVALNRDYDIYERRGGAEINRPIEELARVRRGGQTYYRRDGQEVLDPKDFEVPVRYESMRGPSAAPAQQILRGELERLQAGIDQFGAETFPGIAGVVGRIEDDLRVDSGAERSLAAEMVRRDRDGLSQKDAEAKARLAYNRMYGSALPPAAPNQAVQAAGDINVEAERAARIKAAGLIPSGPGRVVGGVGDGVSPDDRMRALIAQFSSGNFNADVVEANDWRADAEAQEIARQRFGINGGGAAADKAIGKIGDIQKLGAAKNRGPDGQAQVTMPVPGRQVEPTSLPIGLANDLNAPVTDNRFAGPLQKQEQWLVDHAPGYREGKVFGDYPQIAIDAQLQGVGEALAKLKLGDQGIDPSYARVRNLNDLQAAVDEVVRIGGLEGVKFYDQVDGRNVFNADPGIDQVLNKARFNENQKNDLARALFAVEAANRNPANASRKARFKKGKPQPQGSEMGGRRLVKGPRGEYFVVRRPAKQVQGGAQHQLLGGGQIPIGRIGREKIEGREVKSELQALDGRRADPPLDRQELRYARMPDQAVRGGEKAPRAGFIKGDVRAMSRAERVEKFGKRNAAIANRIESRYNAAEEARAANAGPVNKMGRIENPNRGVGRIVPGLDYGTEYPQSATSAAVNPRRTTSPEQGPFRPIDDSIRNQLAELNSGAMQGPRPDYIRAGNKLGKADTSTRGLQNYSKVRNVGRGAAIAGLGAAGLAALIGGERDKREEEAMYR